MTNSKRVTICNQGRRVSNPGTSRELGEAILEWLRYAINERQLIVNDAKAVVHVVSAGVFLVTPTLFQLFAEMHPDWCGRFHKPGEATQANAGDSLMDQARNIARGRQPKLGQGRIYDGAWCAARRQQDCRTQV